MNSVLAVVVEVDALLAAKLVAEAESDRSDRKEIDDCDDDKSVLED